jgi:hypothetical protein
MRGHFPVVLSRDRIGSRFCPLVEHSSTFNQIPGAGHWIPLSATLPTYVGWPLVLRPADGVQIGVLNRCLVGFSGDHRQMDFSHLRQPRPAVRPVNQADQRPHGRTLCCIVWRDSKGASFPAVVSLSGKWLRGRCRMFRRPAAVKPLHETGTWESRLRRGQELAPDD